MQFGLYGINQDALSNPNAAISVAKEAEAAGYDSLWVGEHVVLPDPLTPPPYMTPSEPILDPIVSLTFLAAHTKKILLGTGVIVLPQRNPLILSKSLASLDVLSNGRLVFGLGVGYLEPELEALGIPLEHRGSRTDEYLASILALWTQPQPSFHGNFINFAGIQAYPRPVQQPYPPIVIGGRTVAAHRRATRYGSGWYGFNLSLEETVRQIDSLRAVGQKYKRDPKMGELEISVTPREISNVDEIRQFSRIGVHRIILQLPRKAPTERIIDFVLEQSRKFIL